MGKQVKHEKQWWHRDVKPQRMRRKLYNCNPSICCKDTIITGDGVYVDREVYKLNCQPNCPNKAVCGVVLDLLERGEANKALAYLAGHKQK